MTCDEAREAYSDLYDGHLSGPPLVALDRHLEGCAACRAEWDEFLKAIQVVAELGTAEPSPGFAARVRQRIEAPAWWQRAVRAAFFPLPVKIPIQAVAVALVAFTAVMLFQKSPEIQREMQYAAPAGPTAESYPPAAAAKAAGEKREVEKAPEDRRDAKLEADALRSTAAPERQAAPGEGAPPAAKTAPAQEKDQDRADSMRGSLDRPKTPADQPPPPAGRPEPPPAAPAQQPAAPPPAALPSPAPVPRPPSLFRDEVKELGKVAVPAEAEKTKEPPAGTRAKRADQEAPGARLRRSAPSPATPGRAIAPSQAPVAPPAGVAGSAPTPRPPAAREQVRAQVQEGRPVSIQAGSADDLYSAAITEYARQQYDPAIESFRAFLTQHPRDARVADARFRLGDAYFAQQRYNEAIPEFEAVVRQYPGSPHSRTALFRQGLARLAVGDPAGCQILRDAVSRYPQAAEAAQARETLAARCP